MDRQVRLARARVDSRRRRFNTYHYGWRRDLVGRTSLAAEVVPDAPGTDAAIAAFKRRCKRAGIPVIYVNDNFGKWQSDFKKIVAHCKGEKSRGKPFVELLVPDEDDYFVLNPKNSGFYSTTLDLLLTHLTVKNLILTGIAGKEGAMMAVESVNDGPFTVLVEV